MINPATDINGELAGLSEQFLFFLAFSDLGLPLALTFSATVVAKFSSQECSGLRKARALAKQERASSKFPLTVVGIAKMLRLIFDFHDSSGNKFFSAIDQLTNFVLCCIQLPTAHNINRSTIITMPPRVLCCSNNRAAVADAYSPFTPQLKKSIVRKWEKVSETSSDQTTETRESLDKEQVQPTESIFRAPKLVSEDMDDLLSLKRANPILEDEEEEMPAKRQRKSTTDDISQALTLHWSDQIVEDEEGGYQIIIEAL